MHQHICILASPQLRIRLLSQPRSLSELVLLSRSIHLPSRLGKPLGLYAQRKVSCESQPGSLHTDITDPPRKSTRPVKPQSSNPRTRVIFLIKCSVSENHALPCIPEATFAYTPEEPSRNRIRLNHLFSEHSLFSASLATPFHHGRTQSKPASGEVRHGMVGSGALRFVECKDGKGNFKSASRLLKNRWVPSRALQPMALSVSFNAEE